MRERRKSFLGKDPVLICFNSFTLKLKKLKAGEVNWLRSHYLLIAELINKDDDDGVDDDEI